MIGTNVHILDKNSLMYKKSGVIVGEVGTSWLIETTERKGLVNKKKVEVIKNDKMKTGGSTIKTKSEVIIGNWLLNSQDGRKIVKKSKNTEQLKDNVTEYIKKDIISSPMGSVKDVKTIKDWEFIFKNTKFSYKDGGLTSLGVVTIKFANPKYNYKTNVSSSTTEAEAKKYFVGKMFNVGSYPKENMQKVIDIDFSKSSDKMKTGGGVGKKITTKVYVNNFNDTVDIFDYEFESDNLAKIKKEIKDLRKEVRSEDREYDITGEFELNGENYSFYGAEIDKMKTGGGVNEQGIDLFEDYENIPKKVQTILDKYAEEFGDDFGNMDYKDMANMHDEVYEIGYTFESGLDNQPYDLRPIGTMGKSEVEEYANGGSTKGFNYSIGGL